MDNSVENGGPATQTRAQVQRAMCIRVLGDDGETETPTHFRCVSEIDYDALAAQLAAAERERDALVNTLETIAHDAREYHGELWSAEFAKSALSALERQP